MIPDLTTLIGLCGCIYAFYPFYIKKAIKLDIDIDYRVIYKKGTKSPVAFEISHIKQFDIILTGVMFGDILSDLAAVIVGLLPSASLGHSGPGIFEPVHGSAPKHFGEDTVNPLAAVLSAVMLLRYGLKEENAAKRIEEAVFDVLDRGFRTRDIHTTGTILVGCKRMGQEILNSLDAKVLASNGSLVY